MIRGLQAGDHKGGGWQGGGAGGGGAGEDNRPISVTFRQVCDFSCRWLICWRVKEYLLSEPGTVRPSQSPLMGWN